MQKTSIIIAAAAVICAAAGIGVGFLVGHRAEETKLVTEEEALTSVTLEHLIESASELVSTKYYYTDLDVYESSKEMWGVKLPLSTDKVIFTYSGIISAGIDLAEVTVDVDNDHKTIEIDIPEPKILSHEMDESGFQYYDVQNSIFNETSMSEYTDLIAKLKEDEESKLTEDGKFFEEVTENAKTTLENLLTSTGETQDYKVIFK